MKIVSILAVDLAKHTIQVCGATADGEAVFNRKYTRAKFEELLLSHPKAIVAIEACATSHHWGRIAQKAGHDVRLIPPTYVSRT